MTMPNSVEAGRTFSYMLELDGPGRESFTAEMSVLQNPGDNPTIKRVVEYSCQDASCGYIGTLTAADTTLLGSLSTGRSQWFIHVNAVDSDEDIGELIKLYVTKGWTT